MYSMENTIRNIFNDLRIVRDVIDDVECILISFKNRRIKS